MVTYSYEDAVMEEGEGVVIEWYVTPNCSETRVPSGFNEWRGVFEARLSEAARNGKANSELLGELEDLFNAGVEITSGGRSRTKSVVVRESKEMVLGVLEGEIID